LKQGNALIATALVFGMAISAPSALGQEGETPPYGFWMNRNGWVIEAAPCGDEICGHIVGVGGRTANPQRTDEFNPDPDLRGRSLCGIAIFGAFVPTDDPGEWEGGWIYNPRDGETYSSNMALADDGNLEVRGYVLSPMFGRTIVLTPAEAPGEVCAPDQPTNETNGTPG